MEKTESINVASDKILKLEFTHFALQSWPGRVWDCEFDYVKITDGDGTVLMDKSCGRNKYPTSGDYFQPPIITTKSNMVDIFTKTDSISREAGWNLTWTAVTRG